jgi:hypothetical protein
MLSIDKDAERPGAAASDPRRALVERIVNSAAFAKCERLSSLLAYVCDLTLNGRGKEINEQKIGEAVFGRSRDYDSSIDGIVRTQASRLRQRLDLYFQEEGADEPMRVVIPRGGYMPLFEPRTIPVPPPDLPAPLMLPPEHAPSAVVVQPPAARSVAALVASALPWFLVAMLAVALLMMVLANRTLRTGQAAAPAVIPLWSQMFVAERQTLIVPGDSGLVMWQGLVGRSVGLGEYLSGGYRTNLVGPAAASQKIVLDMGSRRYTSIVDLEVAKSLALVSQSLKSKLAVRYARDVRPNDLKQGNVILVGAAEANPWVELFEHNMNFVFFNDRVRGIFSIRNRAPQGNEPRQWDSFYTDAQNRVYAVVAFMPNLSGNGNALILEGTSMAGTECAWDFVSDNSQLMMFLKRIQRADGTLPHFEVVLGTNNLSGSAVKSTILAWRTGN